MRSILSILIGLGFCGSACAEAPTSGMLARYFGPSSTYGASTSVADVAGGDFVDTESVGGILAIPGADLSGKSNSTLEFTFQSTDSKGIIFTHGLASIPLLLAFEDGSSSTSLNLNSGTPALSIDGSPFSGTTRDQLHDALCDGAPHACVLSSIDFTAHANWASDGLYVGGYNTASFNLTATISNLTLDGHAYTNGNTGTLQGGDTLATLHVGAGNGPGGNLANHGVVLDGSADYVSAPAALINAMPFSVSMWVDQDSALQREYFQFVNASNHNYRTQIRADGTIRILRFDGVTNDFSVSSVAGAVPLGWHHVVIVFVSATEIRGYVDGVEVINTTTATSVAFPASITNVYLGRGSVFWNGAIADALIYNRALSPSEIAQVYAEGVTAETTKYIRLRGIGGKLQTINGSPVGVSQ